MNSLPFKTILLLSLVTVIPCSSFAITVQLVSEAKLGQAVMAMVDSPGDVTLESDIAQMSFVNKGKGLRKVDLGHGKIAGLGIHRVKVIGIDGTASLLIPILFDTAPAPKPSGAGLTAAEQSLMSRYFELLRNNKAMYLSTWPKREFATKSIVKLTTTGTLGLLCAADPSKVTCVPFAGSVGTLISDAMFDYLGHCTNQMEAEIGKADADTIRQVFKGLKAAQITVNVGLGNGIAERVVEGLDVITLILDDKSDVSFVFGLQKDSAGKALKFIQILKKMK